MIDRADDDVEELRPCAACGFLHDCDDNCCRPDGTVMTDRENEVFWAQIEAGEKARAAASKAARVASKPAPVATGRIPVTAPVVLPPLPSGMVVVSKEARAAYMRDYRSRVKAEQVLKLRDAKGRKIKPNGGGDA